MDLGLKGKVAIVTGGSKGLGRAMAHALAAEGMTVSICARDADGTKTITSVSISSALHAEVLDGYMTPDPPIDSTIDFRDALAS